MARILRPALVIMPRPCASSPTPPLLTLPPRSTHLQVNAHFGGGMVATYTVSGPKPTRTQGAVREYFVAAEAIHWCVGGVGSGCT